MTKTKIEEYFYLVLATGGILLATASVFDPEVQWHINLLLFLASAYGILWGLKIRKKRLEQEKQP
jgi:hypothetical protein